MGDRGETLDISDNDEGQSDLQVLENAELRL